MLCVLVPVAALCWLSGAEAHSHRGRRGGVAHHSRAAAPDPLSGVASWYGRSEQGKITASGEKFNRFAMTCAHRTLPLGSTIRVTNTLNGRTAVCRVNDRGPYAYGRVLDPSEAVAIALAYKGGADQAPVQIEVLSSANRLARLADRHQTETVEVAEAPEPGKTVQVSRLVQLRARHRIVRHRAAHRR